VPLSFTVPVLDPGRYSLVVVGINFQADCAAASGGFGVLGTGVEAPRGGGGVGPGSLARTGIAVALLVAIGVALIVVGRGVLEASRRRRRHAARAAAEHRDPATTSR
jgi:hypothetical protein